MKSLYTNVRITVDFCVICITATLPLLQMVNSEFNFYFVYFKASIYVFLLIPSSSDLETGRGLGREKCICLMIFLFFLTENLRVNILLMHLLVHLATAN